PSRVLNGDWLPLILSVQAQVAPPSRVVQSSTLVIFDEPIRVTSKSSNTSRLLTSLTGTDDMTRGGMSSFGDSINGCGSMPGAGPSGGMSLRIDPVLCPNCRLTSWNLGSDGSIGSSARGTGGGSTSIIGTDGPSEL